MNHCDQDLLYKFELDLLDEVEVMKVQSHLNNCKNCNVALEEIRTQIQLLKSFDLQIENIQKPIINQKVRNFTWLKRAAIIIFAMLLGYTGSEYLMKKEKVVIGQTLDPQNYSIDTLKFINCENVDMFGYNKISRDKLHISHNL